MSDLFNLEDELEEAVFQPEDFVRSLCKNKITFAYGIEIHFPSGWKGIVETFIASVNPYSICLTQFTDAHLQLDISFESNGTKKELAVWRSIEEARRQSRTICTCCGQEKQTWRSKRAVSVLCETCKLDAGNLGKTGTWLDKY